MLTLLQKRPIRQDIPMPPSSPKVKLTTYVDPPFAAEIEAEAARLDRSVSWLLEHCWRISRQHVSGYAGPGGGRKAD